MLPDISVGRFSNSEQRPYFNQCGSLLMKAGYSGGYDWTLHVLDKYCLSSEDMGSQLLSFSLSQVNTLSPLLL